MDMKTAEHPIERAARIVGGRRQLAIKLSVTVGAIGNWIERGIPLDHCPYIEQFTGGAVTCEEMRPDKADYFRLLRASGADVSQTKQPGVPAVRTSVAINSVAAQGV